MKELIDELRRRIARIKHEMTTVSAGPSVFFTPWDEQIDARSRVRATLELARSFGGARSASSD
jgi:hypothetical protein